MTSFIIRRSFVLQYETNVLKIQFRYLVLSSPVSIGRFREPQQVDPVIVILRLIAVPIFYNDKTGRMLQI